MHHMPHLWKSDVVDADASKRTQTMKLTEKGLQYRLQQLRERRGKLPGKLLNKFSVTDEMTNLCVNANAVREEVHQFNDTIKFLMSAHEEYQSL